MKKYLFLLLLASIIIFLNIVWLRLSTIPPHWDFAIHLSNSLDYFSFLKEKNIKAWILNWSYYPPFSYYITSFFYLLFGTHQDIAVFSLTPFLIILIFFTYKTAELVGGKILGILACLTLVGIPFLVSQTREYLLDFPLTAMVILNFFLFLKSNFLRNKRHSFLLAISSGVALLTKWTYVIFLIFFISASLIKNKSNISKITQNLITLIVLVFLVAGPWYGRNIFKLKNSLVGNIKLAAEVEKDPPSLSSQSLFWYVNSLYKDYFRFPLLLFFFLAIYQLIKNKSLKNKPLMMTVFLMFFYLAVMTLYRNKDDRFIEPLMPFFAIVIASGALQIKDMSKRYFFSGALIFLALFNYFSSTFGIGVIPKSLFLNFFGLRVLLYRQYGYTNGPPIKENWHIEEIIKTTQFSKNREGFLLVLEKDKKYFNKYTFNYYVKLHKQNLQLDWTILKNNTNKIDVKGYKYIVFNISQDNIILKNIISRKSLKLIAQYDLPDNSKALFFKKESL